MYFTNHILDDLVGKEPAASCQSKQDGRLDLLDHVVQRHARGVVGACKWDLVGRESSIVVQHAVGLCDESSESAHVSIKETA